MATKNEKNVTPAETNAGPGKDFILDDSELETLKSTRGRKEEKSPYLDRVQAAHDTGDVKGIDLSATLKAPWVMSQLRKAAKQLGYDSKAITVFDRSENKSDAHPHGFIAYKVAKSEQVSE
jgi:hypothetical protein